LNLSSALIVLPGIVRFSCTEWRGRMKRTLLFLIIISVYFLFNSCDTPINEYQSKNEDEQEIVDLLLRYTDAVNKGDTEKILTLFQDDGEFVTGRGRVSLAKEKMSKRKPEDWLDDGKRTLYNPEITLTGNEAKVLLQARFGNYKTAKLFTLIKENDEWLIFKRE
jgi:hypothetical protein